VDRADTIFQGLQVDHQDPARWGPRLVRLMQEHVAVARRLEQLSQAQSAAALDGDSESVLATLAERQPLVDQLTDLARALEPFGAVVSTGSSGGGEGSGGGSVTLRLLAAAVEPYAGQLRSLFAELHGLLEGVSARDTADGVTLRGRREAVGRELAGLVTSRTGLEAYGSGGAGTGQTGPRYQDRNA
jgi:hypothetical protein